MRRRGWASGPSLNGPVRAARAVSSTCTMLACAGPLACAVLAASSGLLACSGPNTTPTPDFPIAGVWTETQMLDCETRELIAPEYPIQELKLGSDETFSLIWDADVLGARCVGEVRLVADGRITFVPRCNNTGIDGAGRYFVEDDGTLALVNLFLGRAEDQWEWGCGHRFVPK